MKKVMMLWLWRNRWYVKSDRWWTFPAWRGQIMLKRRLAKITAWNHLFPTAHLFDFLFSQLWQRPSLIPIVWSGLRDTCIYRPINGKLCPTFMELRMVIQCEHLIWSRILCLFNQAQATASKWKKGKMRLRVLINNNWIFKRNVYVLTNNDRVFKMMSVFVCEKELCVNIFFDCCKVLAAPLKRTFSAFL